MSDDGSFLQEMYDAYQLVHDAKEAERKLRTMRLTSLQRFLGVTPDSTRTGVAAHAGPALSAGFKRIELCREALAALDRQGWNRSYHQREFHDHFIRACARIFWKTEKPGTFARDHQRILEVNGWGSLSQEVLISTPRRQALCKSHVFVMSLTFITGLARPSPCPCSRRPCCTARPTWR